MATDEELVERLREFLRASDLTTTTTAIVRRKLEEDFCVDLTEKKAFIREQVDLFLSELENEKKEDDDDDEEDDREGGEEREGGSGEEEEEEDVEEEENDEEERSNGGSSRKRKPNKLIKEVKKRGGGFTKLCSLSPKLQEFVGETELARTEVVKKLWAYIRENNLQDPSNKRKIICDERLHSLFSVNTIDMFQMNKALSKHIWPLNSEDGRAGPVKSTHTEKQRKKEREAGLAGRAKSSHKEKQKKREREDESPRKEKRQKGGSSGFLAPLALSDALMKFIGTGENALRRGDVIKRMWDYIKQNNLQDPANKKNIICDEKLKELFQVNSFTGFTVTKLLGPHFIKTKQ